MIRLVALLALLGTASPLSAAENRDHHGNLLTAEGEFVHANPLIFESSPYLQQHAHNPVQWLPWGEAALAQARAEDKPIFLSIGYATCHWCHVMARESFSDEQVAAVLNADFVPIKVDREERPDIDDVYMAAIQSMRGRGGWPASLWLTPEGEAFDGGTYFRREDFLRKLEGLAVQWHFDRQPLLLRARELTGKVRSKLGRERRARKVGAEVLTNAVRYLSQGEDRAQGGWGVPKFPRESTILYLLSRFERDGDAAALASARRALDAMQAGGIHDQIGGGFARYATDAAWNVPHFEKMLYNQAWLGRCYLEAYRLTADPLYRRTAEGVFEYLRRDMTAPGGAFFSAEDADSEGEEGLFYVWTPAELEAVIGEKEAVLAAAWFGLSPRGNFRELPGRTILTAKQQPAAFAAAQGLSLEAFLGKLDSWRSALTGARARRVRPERDEKVLADWNGFLVGTLSVGARVLEAPELAEAAKKAATFVLKELRDDEGRLLHSWAGGQASVPAFLDDHAALSLGLLELHEATGERRWLDEAVRLHAAMRAQFRGADGAFTRTGPRHETLLSRSKDAFDGAMPSGNALAAWSAVKLWRRTGDAAYRDEADALFAAFGGELEQAHGAAFLLGAFDARLRGEAGSVARDEAGVVRAATAAGPLVLAAGRAAVIEVELELAEGWHVNATGAAPEPLRATELTAVGALRLAGLDAPPGRPTKLAFLDEPARTWEGLQRLSARVEPAEGAVTGPASAVLELKIQACNDRKCLKPEVLRIERPVLVTAPPE